MNKIKNKKIIIILAIIIVIGAIGTTLAYFYSSRTIENTITTAEYSTVVVEEFVSPDNWLPGDTTEKIVNITNDGEVDIAVRAKVEEQWIASDGTTVLNGERDGIKLALYDVGPYWVEEDDGYYYYYEALNPGETSFNFINSVTFNSAFSIEEGLDYECVEVNNNGTIQQTCSNLSTGYAGAQFKLIVTIETIQVEQAWEFDDDLLLYRAIAKQAVMDNKSSDYVTNSTGIKFSSNSSDTNGKGIYTLSSTIKDAYPIHYFRGNVTNNNVLFANYCWKIVRTTETGGIKLVYNGEPTADGKCTNTTEIATEAFSTAYNQNGISDSIASAGYMYNPNSLYEYKTLSSSKITGTVLYGKSFEYENGEYVLTNTTSYSSWSSAYGNLSSYHYTCFNETGTCESLNYIYKTNSSTAYYVILNNGKSIEDALTDMLWNKTSNKTSSNVKTLLDDWYKDNLLSYNQYIENTVYCNDRRINTLGGWSPTGGMSAVFYFDGYNRRTKGSPILSCEQNDAFTLNINSGGSYGYGNNKLIYPIGLLTLDELILAGGTSSNNADYYLYNGQDYHLMTPASFTDTVAREFCVTNTGKLAYGNVYDSRGIRPVISLKSNTKYEEGNGTSDKPYIIKTN